jgi:hypothetical protein
MMFNQYRISSESLLNRHGNVTADGQYVKPGNGGGKKDVNDVKDVKESAVNASLGPLSMGRVSIVGGAAIVMAMAMPIAIRKVN